MYTVRNSEAGRPLTARSIIASTLLGTHPPRLPAARLVRSCGLFGVSENATRVALSRMGAAGEVSYDNGRYELLGRLRERQARQDASRRGPSETAWDGSWLLALIPGEGRPATERSELRIQFRQRRYGEWREGVWIRPDNLRSVDHDRRVLSSCTVVEGGLFPDAKLTAFDVFALGAWAERARELRQDLASQVVRLQRGDASILPVAFATNAAVLRHFQADPFLPIEVLPGRWPGALLRKDFEDFDAAFQTVWRTALHD